VGSIELIVEEGLAMELLETDRQLHQPVSSTGHIVRVNVGEANQ